MQNWFPTLALMLDGYVTLKKLLCLPNFIFSFAKERHIMFCENRFFISSTCIYGFFTMCQFLVELNNIHIVFTAVPGTY